MTTYSDVHNYRKFGALCKKCTNLSKSHITCKKGIVQNRDKKCRHFN